MNQHGYRCPQCGRGDELLVSASTTVYLTPYGVDQAGDTEWTDESFALCDACQWHGVVGKLIVDEKVQ